MIDHAGDVHTQGKLFTGDLFPSNRFGKRFYFAMEKVPREIDDVCVAGRRNAFVVNYSLMEIFQASVMELAEGVLARNFQPSEGNDYFDALWKFLGSPRDWLLSQETKTLDFLRLRRNCFVHRDGTANAALRALERQNGTLLNRYWAKRRKIQQLDFKNASASEIERDELIDVFNISRDLMSTLDGLVIKSFPGAKERTITVCRVVVAGGVAKERGPTSGWVIEAAGVVKERLGTGRGVAAASCVRIERAKT